MTSPDELLAKLSSSQLTEWAAYLDLVDEDTVEEEKARMEIENARVGLLASVIANFAQLGVPPKDRRVFRPSDFTGARDPGANRQVVAMFASLPGAKLERRKKPPRKRRVSRVVDD